MSKRGSLLTDFLFTIFVMLLLLPILVLTLRVLSMQLQFKEDIQDEIALAQLRHILNVSDEFVVSNQSILFQYHLEECELRFINNHMLLSPGTQIFLSDIDSLSFELNDEVIYVIYWRNNHSYKRALCHV